MVKRAYRMIYRGEDGRQYCTDLETKEEVLEVAGRMLDTSPQITIKKVPASSGRSVKKNKLRAVSGIKKHSG